MLLYIPLLLAVHVSCYVKKDCIVGPWGQWGVCDKKCSVGNMLRTRNITQKPNWVFAKICPPLTDKQNCGVENNNCWFTCDELTGDCRCPSGSQLADDKKKCLDVNECKYNNGLGPCSQICTNIKSSYTCSCHKGFYLSNDKHDCIYDTAQDLCSTGFKHTIIRGKCACANGFNGLRCDRNEMLCPKSASVCSDQTESCLTFVNAPTCIKSEYQFPVLLHVPYDMFSADNYRYKIEIYIEKLLSGGPYKVKSLHSLNTITPRSDIDSQHLVVEGINHVKVKSAYVFLYYVALKQKSVNIYKPIKAKDACKKLHGTSVQCMHAGDCEILKSAGYKCPSVLYQRPSVGKQQGGENKTTSYFWLLLLSLPVLAVIAYFVYRKYKKSKSDFTQIQYNDENIVMIDDNDDTNSPRLPAPSPRSVEFTQPVFNKEEPKNILYGQESIEEPMYESIDNLSKTNMDEKGKIVVDLNDPEPRYSKPPNKSQAEAL